MSTIVTATALGKHLGISRQRVSALADEGVFRKLTGDLFDQDECRLAYIAWLREAKGAATRTAAHSRVQDARAREIDLRIAEREGRLIEVDRALAIVDDIVGTYRTGIDGLAARVTRDLDLRGKIEDEVFRINKAVSDIFARKASEIRPKGA